MDIFVKIENYNEDLIKTMESQGIKLFRQGGNVSDSFLLSFMKGNFIVDFYFGYMSETDPNFRWVGYLDLDMQTKMRLV